MSREAPSSLLKPAFEDSCADQFRRRRRQHTLRANCGRVEQGRGELVLCDCTCLCIGEEGVAWRDEDAYPDECDNFVVLGNPLGQVNKR